MNSTRHGTILSPDAQPWERCLFCHHKKEHPLGRKQSAGSGDLLTLAIRSKYNLLTEPPLGSRAARAIHAYKGTIPTFLMSRNIGSYSDSRRRSLNERPCCE